MSGNPRPAGVSILSILNIIGGIFLILPGIGLIVVSVLLGELSDPYMVEVYPTVQLMLPIGVILLVFGIFSIVVGYGLWNGKSWSRILVIVLYVLGLVSGVLFFIYLLSAEFLVDVLSGEDLLLAASPLIPSLVICLFIIYYLTRPHVTRFFGKAEMIERKPVTVTAIPEERIKYCWWCGTEMPEDARYCPECGKGQ